VKIILLQDVKSLGKKDEIVNVNDGYARNYIIPKKLGIEASAKNLNDLKFKKAGEEKNAKELLDSMKSFADSIAGKSITIKMKAGEGGKLFGSISTKEIGNAYKEQFNIDIDKKKIQLSEPIRSFGEFKVPIKLHPQVTGTLTVIVSEA